MTEHQNTIHPNENEILRDFENRINNLPSINSALYSKYGVKRGLRDISGQGVMAGLTEISKLSSYMLDENEYIPVPGKLFYRGIDIDEIVNAFLKENRHGFEETCFLLLFGELPTLADLEQYKSLQASYRSLPEGFVRDQMMKAPSNNIINLMARSILTLYSYDADAEDNSLPNVLRQSLQLIAQLPLLAAYGYQAYIHYFKNQSMIIHSPVPEYSTAENFLHMLRPDKKFSALEAKLLDLSLVLHAEHGGGNNSSFTTHVVTSTGTDTYSSVAASLGSLKGIKHGGASMMVTNMFADMKKEVKNWQNEDEVRQYLKKILNKEAFDGTGFIYGIGHAVYSLSDPRALQLKKQAKQLADSKGLTEEFQLYSLVERLAPEVISSERRMYKGVSANVDFYSGFVYQMLNLPPELFTPIFAMARIVGWSAHRIEELKHHGKVIRPGYMGVSPRRRYIELDKRK